MRSLVNRQTIGIISLIVFALCCTLVFDSVITHGIDPFHRLANDFLRGRVDSSEVGQGQLDYSYVNGTAYWPQGPFPALIYVPFVLLGDHIEDAALTFFLALVILWIIFALARKVGFDIRNAAWASFAFTFASPLLYILWAPRSSFLAHAIVVACLFGAFLEYYGKRRWWIIGLCYALILATRTTAVVSAVYFILDLLWKSRGTMNPTSGQALEVSGRVLSERFRLRRFIYKALHPRRALRGIPGIVMKKTITSLSALCTPILITLAALLWYNVIRFGSLFDFGYQTQNVHPILAAMRVQGMFGLVHIPGNVYYFLLAGPLPVADRVSHLLVFPYINYSQWGIGLIFSAPYFFSPIWKWYRDRTNMLLGIAAGITAVPILTYYGVGVSQMGYRYALDFLPLLFLIFLRTTHFFHKEFPFRFRAVFVLTFLFNAYLFAVQHVFVFFFRDRILF